MKSCIKRGRYLWSIILTVLVFNNLAAQTYALNNGFINNQTIYTCSGTFYDSNIGGNYSPNENYTVTFSPATVGKIIQFSFSELSIDLGDTLFVYDGNNRQSKIIDTFSNVAYNYSQAISPSDTNSTGSLTFYFKSNASNQASGWVASVKCAYPCIQKIISTISTNPPKNSNNYTDFCLVNGAGTIDFTASTIYPNNGIIYNQSDATSRFHWFFGDGKDTAGLNLTSIKHKYIQEGGFNVKLLISDTNGCANMLPIQSKVRTGIKPNFSIVAPASMCAKDTLRLTPSAASTSTSGGFVIPQMGNFLTLPISSDSLFLPDGSGVTYSSNITINQFSPGQTLNSISDLVGIIINMEHSYLGDLNISLTAPNGVTVNLKKYPGGLACYLGEPVDEDSPQVPLSQQAILSTIPGKGYTYIFNDNPQHKSMTAESGNFTYTFTDNAGRIQSNKVYLPAGSYASEDNLSALVGTPLNGTWTLKIKDNLSVDNGFLFNWKLDFNPTIFPNVETYNVPIVSQTWVTPSAGLNNVLGTVATIIPPVAGNYSYTYKVVDAYGCNMDTTINIQVIATPEKPNLGNDVAFCNTQTSVNLSVLNTDNTAFYTWNTGATANAITVNSTGTYIVTANNSYGCKAHDTIIVKPQTPIYVNLGLDTMYCASNRNLLKASVSANVISYLWDDGSTNDTLRISGIGNYKLTVKSDEGCTEKDDINLTNNPINDYVMPADSTICENSSYLLSLNLPTSSSVVWNDGFTGASKRVYPNNVYYTTANHVGCLKSDTLTVSSKPLPVISLGSNITLCESQTQLLKVSYNGASFLWSDGSIDSSFLVKNENTYWVEATYNGCNFRDSIFVKYKKCDCNTFLPNAFSPNGDGINDIFKPKMDCVPIDYQLTIFNRYGQIVFESLEFSKGWDGKWNNAYLPNGTYYYILTYRNMGLSLAERFSGSITIIR